MIKFFRKIRQKLLSDNKFGKYLTYAIGEIVLVMIGILLALQVNNWNEERKFKEYEINILNNLVESLKEDLPSFNMSLSYCERNDNSILLLLSWMEQDLIYQDSLKYHFGNTNSLITPSINSSVFKTLISRDLNLISNKELRQNIVQLFDTDKSGMEYMNERYRDILEDASIHLYDTRFDAFWNTSTNILRPDKTTNSDSLNISILNPEMVPIDFESLKKDQEYLYFLKSLKNRHHYYMSNNIKNVQASIHQLIAEMEDELKILEE